MKWTLVMLGMCIASSTALAGELGASRPSSSPRSTPTTNPVPHPTDADGRRLPPGAHPTDEQIQQAEAFLKANSPNRYDAYQRFKGFAGTNGRPGRLEQYQQAMVRGYIELRALEKQDSELYQMKIDELSLEDQITGLVMGARNENRLEAPEDRKALREKMRPLFQDLLKKRAEETNHRIRKIQDALDAQKQQLHDLQTADTTDVDTWMDHEMDTKGRFSMGFAGIALKHLPNVAQDHRPAPTTSAVNADTLH